MPTYWNFNTDKPIKDTNLKADWGLHEYKINYHAPTQVQYTNSSKPTKTSYTIQTPAWNIPLATFTTPGERGPANFLGWAFSLGGALLATRICVLTHSIGLRMVS